MRHKNLFVAAAVLASAAGNAAAAGEISFGAKAGIIVSSITQTPEDWEQDKAYKTGFTGGVFMNYAFNERFAVQPELLYTQKGVRDNLYDGLILVDLEAHFDYLELPVLAIYTFSPKSKPRPFVYGGPSFAYCIGSELEVSASIFSVGIDFSDLTHVTDFGLVAGGGLDYPVGNGSLLLDARFHLGFTNVILSGDFEINGSTHTIDEDDFKNFGFNLMLGYVF